MKKSTPGIVNTDLNESNGVSIFLFLSCQFETVWTLLQKPPAINKRTTGQIPKR